MTGENCRAGRSIALARPCPAQSDGSNVPTDTPLRLSDMGVTGVWQSGTQQGAPKKRKRSQRTGR